MSTSIHPYQDLDIDFVFLPEVDIHVGLGGGGDIVPVYEYSEGDGWNPTDAIRSRVPMRRTWLAEMGLSPEFTDIVQFRGDSMIPVIEDGDWGFIDRRATFPSPPDLYVLWDGYGVVAKHLEISQRGNPPTVRIVSANHAAYKTVEEPLDQINIIGRVARLLTKPRAVRL